MFVEVKLVSVATWQRSLRFCTGPDTGRP